MKKITLLLSLVVSLVYLPVSGLSTDGLSNVPVGELRLREPIQKKINKNKQTNIPVQPKGMSDFAASPFKLSTSVAQVPTKTRLRMIVDTPVSANQSKIGDRFAARILDDFYLTGDYRKLIVPKHSWIRGKVSFVKKPRLLSRSGKLAIKLDTMVTPQGDYVPLDADLTFMLGVVNKKGLLDPQTGFKDKAMAPTDALLSSGAGKAVSIATLGAPVLGTLLGGSVIALFAKGDAATVYKGQELQIVITQNTDLAL